MEERMSRIGLGDLGEEKSARKTQRYQIDHGGSRKEGVR